MTTLHRTLNIALTGVGATLALVLIRRALKRRSSVEIRCSLCCECGKVQGEIRAKPQDAIRLLCYCKDCQEYAKFVAQSGKKKDNGLGVSGSTPLVQVCKNAITIETGKDQLQLARKTPPPQKGGKTPSSMHRYYANCCNVPIMNTRNELGFVGVFADRLDENIEKFAPFVRFGTESATGPPMDVPDINIFHFLWNLLRYAPWAGSGPFEEQESPVYWGDNRLH